MKSNVALLLASGYGTRLSALQLGVPKPMAPVDGKPFLELLFKKLYSYNIRTLVLTVNKRVAIIKNTFKSGQQLGIKLHYSFVGETRGNAISIAKSLQWLPEHFFIINADTIFNFNPNILKQYHLHSKAAMTLALVKKSETKQYGSVVIDDNGRVTDFIEKGKEGVGLVFAGVVYVNKRAFKEFYRKKNIVSLERNIFPKLANMKKLYGLKVSGNFWDIGTPESYAHFNNNFKRIQL
jgi:NDP-sugar pyrophosphorylase family protein